MTLREIGTGISEWFSEANTALTTKSVLDWPLSLLLVSAIVALFGLVTLLVMVGTWRENAAFERRRRLDWERENLPPSGLPTDPAERLEWANRTGRYAPPNEKGQ